MSHIGRYPPSTLVVAIVTWLASAPLTALIAQTPDTSDAHHLVGLELAQALSMERRLVVGWQQMAERAHSVAIRDTLKHVAVRAEERVQHLEQAFMLLDRVSSERVSAGFEGLWIEWDERVRDFKDSPLLDLVLIAGARKVLHYRMMTYASLIGLAEHLGEPSIADLLRPDLDEDEIADGAMHVLGRQRAAEIQQEMTQ